MVNKRGFREWCSTSKLKWEVSSQEESGGIRGQEEVRLIVMEVRKCDSVKKQKVFSLREG